MLMLCSVGRYSVAIAIIVNSREVSTLRLLPLYLRVETAITQSRICLVYDLPPEGAWLVDTCPGYQEPRLLQSKQRYIEQLLLSFLSIVLSIIVDILIIPINPSVVNFGPGFEGKCRGSSRGLTLDNADFAQVVLG